MHFDFEVRYDAPPGDVMAMLLDPAFRQQAAETTSRAAEAEVRGTAEQPRVTIRRTIPTEEFSHRLQAAVGDHLTITVVEQWSVNRPDGSRTAQVSGEVAQAPVTVQGTITLDPSDGGTHYRMDGQLRVRVPFLGSRVERGAVPVLRERLRSEASVGQVWLASRDEEG